jgi:hypothetical protein
MAAVSKTAGAWSRESSNLSLFAYVRDGPVAQMDQSTSLRSLRSQVQVLPGPPNCNADVAQPGRGTGLRNQLMRVRLPPSAPDLTARVLPVMKVHQVTICSSIFAGFHFSRMWRNR